MNFPFNRQTSKDFLFKKREALRSSLNEGSNKIFNSASDVKNGLFGGLSSVQSRFDTLSHKVAHSLDIESTKDDEPDLAAQRPKVRPPVPPLPKRLSIDRASTSSQNHVSESQQRKRISGPDVAINFDEPLFDKPDLDAEFHPTPGGQSTANPFNSVGNKESLSSDLNQPIEGLPREDSGQCENEYDDPFGNQYGRQYDNQYGGQYDNQYGGQFNDQYGGEYVDSADLDLEDHPVRPDLMQRRQTNPFIDAEDIPEMNSESNDKNQVPSDLLVPGIPRIPSKTGSNFPSAYGGLTVQISADLLAITPTSERCLPLPTLNPSQATVRHTESDEVYDDSDGDSVATEGCDEVQNGEDVGDNEGGIFRSGSVASDISWSSNDSHVDEMSRECMEFMRDFVVKIFDNSTEINPIDKARFGELCQTEVGRLWFARYISSQRVHNQKVIEHTFFQLVQFLAIALFECNLDEDYNPAKTLMNMCFTFYYETPAKSKGSTKNFLYVFLKDQPIWQNVKFWNAAFFDAVQCEKARPQNNTDDFEADKQYEANIVFGQLGTFSSNMRAFSIPPDVCFDFLKKQAELANLSYEQLNILMENINRQLP